MVYNCKLCGMETENIDRICEDCKDVLHSPHRKTDLDLQEVEHDSQEYINSFMNEYRRNS